MDEDLFAADDVEAGGEAFGGLGRGYVMAQKDALHVVDVDGVVGGVGVYLLNAGGVVHMDYCDGLPVEAEFYCVDPRFEGFWNPRVVGGSVKAGVGYPCGEGCRHAFL